MIWSRTILDGIVMCVIFNVTVALTWLLTPNSFSGMLPAEIRKAAPKRTKREILVLACVLYPLYIGLIAYAILSAYLAGASGFWNLFWMGYIEMFFVNLGDFFGLDWWFRAKVKDRAMLPGTEHCKAWNTKEWMLTLAIPEHCLGWPLVICPLVGFTCAGIGTLIR